VKIIDLSVCIEEKCYSEEIPAKIKYINHNRGGTLLGLGILWKGKNIREKIIHFLNGLITGRLLKSKDFPESKGLSTEIIKLSTHTGTHLDSPYHYGEKNQDFDSIPLENFYGNGVILDFSNRNSKEAITRYETEMKLLEIQYSLKPKDIVLIMTGAYGFYGQEKYKTQYVGLTIESLEYLLNAGIKVIGTDAFVFLLT